MLLALLVAAAPRLLQLDLPLERDEGEYAYVGALLLGGAAPYEGAYTMKLPGTHGAYALFQAAAPGPGSSRVRPIRIGVLAVHGLCVLLVFALGRRWLDPPGAAVASLTYALLTVGGTLLGLAGHATHFVVLGGLSGLALLLAEPRGPEGAPLGRAGAARVVAAGACLGLAVLCKQSGASFMLYAVALTAARRRWGRLALLCAGFAAPLAGLALWLALAGTWSTFAFLGIEYASSYAGGPLLARAAERIPGALREVVLPTLPFWCLALAGLGREPSVPEGARPSTRGQRLELALLGACSLLGVLPGAYLRPHYFIALAPALAILAARGLSRVEPRGAALALWVAGAALLGWNERALVTSGPGELSRRLYPGNPFVESEACAAWLVEHAAAGDRLAVLGSEPQLPYLSGLTAATGYLYVYPLMEAQPHAARMQRQFIAEVEAVAPRFVVDVRSRWSWLERPDSIREVLDWRPEFLAAHYAPVARFGLGEEGPGSSALVLYEREPR